MKTPYHKGNVRERLLEQGREILASEGLEHLTFRRLARKVGIVPSSIYNHFKSRDEMMAALTTDGFRKLIDLQKKAFASGGNFKGSMKAVARAYLIFADQNPHLYRLMFSWEFNQARAFPELVRAGTLFFALSVRWWYQEEYDESRPISDYPAPLLAWSAIHGLSMFVIQRSLVFEGTTHEDLERLVDKMEDYLLPALEGSQ